MWLTDVLAAWHTPSKGRTPQPPDKTPFKPELPLILKDRVSGKHDKSAIGDCLHEVLLVISCLSKNDYENRLCQQQVTNFNNCYKKYLVDKATAKKSQERGILVPGDKNLTHKQLRKLFRTRPML